MRKIFFSLLFVSLFFLISCNEEAPVEQSLTKGQNELSKITTSSSFIVIVKGNKLPENLGKSIEAINGSFNNSISELGLAFVSSDDPNFSLNASKISGVQSVVPDIHIQWLDPEQKREALELEAANPPFTGDDDFFFDLQWGHDAIDAPEAWETGQRGAGVRVAVLDDGIDSDHPDIAPNLNVGLSTSFVPGETFEYIENFPGDPFSHGTHTSGTVAAADNGYGTIGVAPEAELVMIKVLSSLTGSGSFSGIINGIYYAASIDADIISMSIGAYIKRSGVQGIYTAKEATELLGALSRATNYADQMGSILIASAGNSGIDGDHIANWLHLPSDAVKVISISATAPVGWATDPSIINLDNLASYSNYGQSFVDFAAPGGDFVYPGNELCVVAGILRPCWVFDLVFSTGSAGKWYWSAGTSMAAPHVAGVAALIIGANGGSMKPAQVESILSRSADDLGKPGNDDFYGAGRVNAYNAVK